MTDLPRGRMRPLWRAASLVAALFCLMMTGWSAARAAPSLVEFPGPDGLVLQAWLYEPPGAGPHPAVVALHGCAGLTDASGKPSARHADWGERLSAQGFLVLFPDSFASRGLGAQCKVRVRQVHPSRERVADGAAARAYLATRPDVKQDAISLLGWSNGGSTVLYAVEPRHTPRDGGADFAKAVAFYPGCRQPFETGRWHTRLPLLILVGEADDWTDAAACHTLSDDVKGVGPGDAGGRVTLVTYPGAFHDFDHPGLPVHVVEGLAFAASGTGSAHTGTDPAARADAILRVSGFLAR